MDAISDRDVGEVVIMSSSQVGKTEILINVIGYYIHHDPAPILVVQPTIKMAETFSKDRLAPMLRDSPALRGKVKDPRERDSGNTIDHKIFDGGHITLAGSNSPASLASRPIRILLVDELDRFDESIGDEGDPLSIVMRRTARFWNRKVVVVSTPTIKGQSRIASAYEGTDKRRCYVPCPDCGHAQELKWHQVRWDKETNDAGETIKHHPETAHYVCENCGVLWNDVARWGALRNCFWRATAPFHGIAGFGGIWEAHAFGSKLSEIVRAFLAAKRDPSKFQTFVNTVLGEVWEESGETVQAHSLVGRIEAYDDRSMPEDISILTAGVDVQDNRLEVQVVGWGPEEESWVVWYEVIHGDPAQGQVWKDLDGVLLSSFHTAGGRTLRIGAACIDTGGHHGAQVYSFCKSRPRRRIFPTKGAYGPRPIWPPRASRGGPNSNENVYLIGVDTAKDTTYGRLKISSPGPGYVHFPSLEAIDEGYFDQLTSERVVTRYREGRPYRVWIVDKGKRNEALDTFVLALAARHSLPRRIERGLAYRPELLPVSVEEERAPQSPLNFTKAPARPQGASKPFRFGRPLGMMRDPYL